MQIKSIENQTYLEFTNPILSAENGNIEYFNVKLSSPIYFGKKQVYLYDGPKGLIELFDKMAKNCTGWKKEIIWGSIENDLSITAISDKLGHITLKIELQQVNIDEDNWVLKGQILIESGQLEQIANDIKLFFKKQ
jgi:hypothetical protein